MVVSSFFDKIQARKPRKQQANSTFYEESKVESQKRPQKTSNSARKNRKRNAYTTDIDNSTASDLSPASPQSNRAKRSRHAENKLQQRRPSFQPLSKEVIDFSNRLKDLSRQKNLEALLELYYMNEYDSIRDEHHACMVIDACAKCGGNILAAEHVVTHLGKANNVETQTALLKVYVYAGSMTKAWHLFQQIECPNVRTLNTLLRGCLWSATSTVERNGDCLMTDDEFVGGVITSEKAWKHCLSLPSANSNIKNNNRSGGFQVYDVSSYEYAITLLCQALRFKEAELRILEFCDVFGIRFKGTAKIASQKDLDQTVAEALAVCYLALSRAYALLHHDALWASCQRCLSAIKLSRGLMQDLSALNDSMEKSKDTLGGKRGWKNNSSACRESSNISFREHRLSEFEAEVRTLLKRLQNKTLDEANFEEIVSTQLRHRFLYFSGGSITSLADLSKDLSIHVPEASPNQSLSNLGKSHLVASWYSFGLSHLVSIKLDSDIAFSDNNEVCVNDIESRCRIIDDHSADLVNADGTLDFDRIFSDGTFPVDIEIGAGFGSWIVHQAKENLRKRNYVAVELRADRCYQIFTRALLEFDKPLDNVCVVGSDCCTLLQNNVKRGSVSTFYANHPEPPTQVIGDDPNYLRELVHGRITEPAHMLTSATILSMSYCLKKNGQIMVVSDNRSFTRLLAATFCKVVRENKNLLRSVRRDGKAKISDDFVSLDKFRHTECFQSVVDLYSYDSRTKGGTSYFDRLWRTGAGSHSETHTRFVILMQRC